MANVDDDDNEVSETIPDLEEPVHDHAPMKLVRPVVKPLINWILCKDCRKEIIPEGALCKCGGTSS